MNQKIMALMVAAAVCLAGTAAFFLTIQNEADGNTINLGMTQSTGGETFGFGDMGTYYFHTSNAYHENLVALDKDGNYTGLLAESWSVNEDASEWTFTLRNGVYWTDGTKFSADDVLFTIDYTLEKKPWGMNDAAFLNNLESKSKGVSGDKETVTLIMSQPYSNLLLNMRCGLSIIPKHVYEDVGDPMTYGDPATEMDATIGTGPYIVKNLDKVSRTLSFEANEKYYLGTPKTKNLLVRYYADDNVIVEALKKGDIDVILAWKGGVGYDSIIGLQQWSGITLDKYDNAGLYGLCFNTQHTDFTSKELREALSYCVNYPKLIEKILSGYGRVPGKSTIPSCMMHYKDAGLFEYNIDKAKVKLDAIGYKVPEGGTFVEKPGGEPFMPTLSFPASNIDMARIIQEGFNSAGVDLQLNLVSSPWGKWKKTDADNNGIRDYEMILSGCSQLGTYTWAGYGTTLVDKDGGLQDCQVVDPEFKEIVGRLNSANTEGKLKTAAEELQEWYAANVPMVPLYEKEVVTAKKANISGVTMDQQFGYTVCHYTLMNIEKV